MTSSLLTEINLYKISVRNSPIWSLGPSSVRGDLPNNNSMQILEKYSDGESEGVNTVTMKTGLFKLLDYPFKLNSITYTSIFY